MPVVPVKQPFSDLEAAYDALYRYCYARLLYAAKWLAGATVTFAAGALFAGITCGIAFALYGTDGANGAIQLSLPFISRHLTFGQAAAVLYLLGTALLALGGRVLWRRHQVKGR